MKNQIIGTCIFALWTTVISAQKQPAYLQQKIASWQTSAELKNSSIGIAVTDNLTGEELVKTVPQLSLVPASILKTVTTATALDFFGSGFRFKTTLSYSGTVRNDTLLGNLQITGGGDPTLGSMYFPDNINFLDEWVKVVASNRIRVVTGNLIVDASIYEKIQVPGSWVWEDLGNYFGAGASGLSVFDNMYEIHLKSPATAGKPTKITKITPEIQGLDLQNEVSSSDVNSDQSYVFGSPEDSRRVIRGTIPKDKSDFVVKASVPNPPALLANEFRNKLANKGIILKGTTNFAKAITENSILTETLSPPLRDIIRATNYESVNLFAEHFLKHLAWQKTGLGTTGDGCKFIIDFWKDKGLDVTGFFMNDGSGLSRFNAITASQMCGILNYMKTKSIYSADFYQSLPLAGNGTLTAFNAENFPNNCLRAKSGSMTRVRCYAGYLTTDSGRQLSFAVMLNNFSCSMSEATRKIEELLMELRKL
jgi:D-alanyl-D-alanine carboxypeptidase/D-alanyl-D-alanine-endopeptidase (penicillin-binding protein 4)